MTDQQEPAPLTFEDCQTRLWELCKEADAAGLIKSNEDFWAIFGGFVVSVDLAAGGHPRDIIVRLQNVIVQALKSDAAPAEAKAATPLAPQIILPGEKLTLPQDKPGVVLPFVLPPDRGDKPNA